MFSKSVILGSFLFAAAASVGGPAAAEAINVHGSICHHYNAGEALDIDFTSSGVQNIRLSPRQVICPVPRTPLRLGARAEFWVDGTNLGATATSCTVWVTRGTTGFLVGTRSFVAVGPAWSQSAMFAPNQVGPADYVSMICTLPGSRTGTIYGVSAVEPSPR